MNVRSLVNKMDEMELQIVTNSIIRDSCILLITEIWLHSLIPDSAMELAGFTAQCYDRPKDSGKNRGGGLCVCILITTCPQTQ